MVRAMVTHKGLCDKGVALVVALSVSPAKQAQTYVNSVNHLISLVALQP